MVEASQDLDEAASGKLDCILDYVDEDLLEAEIIALQLRREIFFIKTMVVVPVVHILQKVPRVDSFNPKFEARGHGLHVEHRFDKLDDLQWAENFKARHELVFFDQP